MKHIKSILEFNYSDIGNTEQDVTFDFSPRGGLLNIIKGNNLSRHFFNEAYRLVLDYLEETKIKKSINDLVLMNNIIEYVNDNTSDLVKNHQTKIVQHEKLSNEQLLVIDRVMSLSIDHWSDYTNKRRPINDFIRNNFGSGNYVSDIILLDKMIFYYEGFVLDLKTKQWTPPKNINVNSLEDVDSFEIFKNYNFQKKYLNNNPSMIFNFPEELLNDRIIDEYGYILKSKKYNL